MKTSHKALQHNSSILELSTAAIGTYVMIGKMKLKVTLTTTGCRDCVFQTDEGARFCQYSAFCFAHNRLDRKPVKFLKWHLSKK